MSSKSPANIKAVAFDLDGLMVNTEDIYDKVMLRVLEPRGFQFSLDLKLAMMGQTARDAFAVLKNRCSISDTLEELQSEVEDLYLELLPEIVEPMPGLRKLFEIIDRENIPRAVTTSSPRKLAQATLGFARIKDNFRFILTGDDVQRGKPDPQVYQMAAEKFSVEPFEMLVLEDSRMGSLAAARAGAFTIAVPGSHSVDQDFSHVDQVFQSLHDEKLLKLFGQS